MHNKPVILELTTCLMSWYSFSTRRRKQYTTFSFFCFIFNDFLEAYLEVNLPHCRLFRLGNALRSSVAVEVEVEVVVLLLQGLADLELAVVLPDVLSVGLSLRSIVSNSLLL